MKLIEKKNRDKGYNDKSLGKDKFSQGEFWYILGCFALVCFIIGGVCLVQQANHRFGGEQELMPGLTIASMDLTVFNVTETHLSAKWDLLIQVPENLAGNIYLPEDLQASFLYKNVTFTTTSTQRLPTTLFIYLYFLLIRFVFVLFLIH